ncbi:tripartite motif-containing protein 43-like [Camelus ferus]|uniref:Tripartite motif-containing protein 43-like n=3 Tax=Camelus TaxID=9836 RepID=A0A8B8TWL8_CAMFR|nr:tripartite motif-containing protein 43-like [Camelus ferus]XP_045365039.1 tripartite motif-containing protein 43-like [Camelus bactrianus]
MEIFTINSVFTRVSCERSQLWKAGRLEVCGCQGQRELSDARPQQTPSVYAEEVVTAGQRNMSADSFQDDFTCSVCFKHFIDPVTLGCGHSFCMPCLCIGWEEAQDPPRCPVCRATSHPVNLKTNIILKTRVFLARRTSPCELPSSAKQTCEIHMSTKSFFCEVTKDALCLPCCQSKAHVTHGHCSIEWMAEEYRQKLLKQMRSVWEKTQENKRNLNRETSKVRMWEGYVTLWRKMIFAEYWKMCPLGDHEETRYLERIEEESKEIFQQLKESQHNMDVKGQLLRGIYEELKELCRRPDMDLLQGFETVLEKSESAQLHMPQPLVPEFGSCPRPGLINWLDQFQVYVALDNETVTCQVPLFEDLRRLLSDRPDVANNPTRSKYFLAWGAESFTSGQHYWEVDVADCANWAIGFCNDSWTRKNDMVVDSEGIFLLFCIKENNQCHLFTSSPLLPQYVKRPLGHVGVFLDYEGGVVSFVNVARSSLICSFLSCSFSSPLKPFLCSGHP